MSWLDICPINLYRKMRANMKLFLSIPSAARLHCQTTRTGKYLAVSGLWALSLSTIAFSQGATPAVSCASLAKLSLPNTTISVAEEVQAGSFKPPSADGPGGGGGGRQGATFGKLPAFCRVAGDIHPVADSDIKFEVWMPLEGWNGRFEAVGNGGLAGTLSYPAMGQALADGYATGSTDTGHPPGQDPTWALGHPEKVIDFGYRAVHEMTVKSKATVEAFYGSGPKYSYWNGCSEGGRQGMGEAQRYPADFNGILAGSPVFQFTHGQTRWLWNDMLVYKNPSGHLSPANYQLIHKAVLDQCDAADGVKDGVVNDPQQCHFDPSVLLCKNGETDDCLTAPQIREINAEYADALNPRTHEMLARGHEPGFEIFETRPSAVPDKNTKQSGFYPYFVFENPNWDWTTIDFDKDVATADKKWDAVLSNYDTDLSKFKAAGGKLIQYHGWSDPLPAPMATVDYFEAAQKKVGDTQAFYRLFMVPGMGHCGGGPGTDQFEKMTAITDWVEHGKAPNSILASHLTAGKVDRTRPLCPYPQVAKYTGNGSTDDAANFVCAKP